MPQDGLRSSIYRSFVTCDDPKGVVNCRTIRKSKSYSLKMNHHKRERQRKLKNLSTTSLNYEPELEEIMASKGNPEETHSPASFQLMEVSKGAKKLNHMIDSWTKGVKFDGQSKDIAKDLLKGALDLQDSLVMLGKLQEASQYMAHLKKKQIEKSERGKEDEPWIRRTSSDQFRDHFSVTRYQKPRLSVDGYPSNSTEELKKVIKESLVSQNLLSKARKHHHEKARYVPQMNLDSASTSGSPSTSSTSQSSLARLTTNSPTASTSVYPQTTKGLNLIAKLMGLEECPSKPLQITPQNQFEGQKKTQNQLEPVLDIDKPKVKQSQYGVQKADPERRTLNEILENMQYKGLLRSKCAKELQPCLNDFNVSRSRQRLSDNGPPIVLIKPLRVPCQGPKETNRPAFEEDDPLYRRKMLRKLRRKEELYPKGINCKDGNVKPDMVIRRRPHAEETTIRGLKQEAAKEKRVVVETPVEKEVAVNERSAIVKLKAYQSANQKQQKSEDIDNRTEKILKVTTVNRKSLDKDVVKTKSVPKSEVQAKKTPTKALKPESESNMTRKQISRQPSTKTGATKNAEQGAACNSIYQRKNRMKKDKPVNKPTAAKTVAETSVREEDEKMDNTREIDCHVGTISSTLENQLPELEGQPLEEEDIDSSGTQIGELGREGKISLFEIVLPTPSAIDETDSEKAEEALKTIDVCQSTYDKSFTMEASLREVLLSSLSFQSCAEELFDVNTNSSSMISSSIIETTCIDDFEAPTLRLPLECAKEIIELKSFQDSQTVHPLLPYIGKPRRSISIEMLVEEVMKGIEALAIYSKPGEDLADCLYATLERDLTCNGVVNGMWDSGWKTGFSLDDAEQVVNDVEKLVLTGLIEEVFA
ncbi:uncharacterized protein LOC133797048 [Humulus lupulus]|uniref:uncharacterized protein LOC133797048 n=1 Tax=Humulus lupulus TaxID=3486 RepID=UPI002B40830A|nr:uncharacterized protein LOC133797048 [Humulus lupulus]XP_062090800.1 uncharacterized protein LOC133797048 [Humulus lupulus]